MRFRTYWYGVSIILSLNVAASLASRLIRDPGSQSGIYSTFDIKLSKRILHVHLESLTERESLEEDSLLRCQFWESSMDETADD